MTTKSNDTYVYAGAEVSGIYRLSPGSSQWEELTQGLPVDPVSYTHLTLPTIYSV